jgi:hypothetical protein
MRSILVDHSMSRLRLASSYLSITVILTITGGFTFTAFPLLGDPLFESYPLPPRNASAVTQPVRKVRVGQVFRQTDEGIMRPVLLQRADPQYSDKAREARIQGTVVLEGIVEADGSMTVDRVARGLDPGPFAFMSLTCIRLPQIVWMGLTCQAPGIESINIILFKLYLYVTILSSIFLSGYGAMTSTPVTRVHASGRIGMQLPASITFLSVLAPLASGAIGERNRGRIALKRHKS